MLSEKSKLTEKSRLRALAELERPVNVRLKFRKVGSLQYISHLDLQRTFMRVIVRACIPAWYTKGFNPHAKLVFSTPLSVGAQSVYEFLDVRIDREMSCEEIKNRLNAELTDELYISEAYIPTKDFSEIAWSSYEIEIKTDGASCEMAEAIKKLLLKSPLMMLKKSKSGEKEVDIIPMIRSVDAYYRSENKTIMIKCLLSASSTVYLNPEMLITALKQNLCILNGNPTEEWYTILRTGLYTEELELFK